MGDYYNENAVKASDQCSSLLGERLRTPPIKKIIEDQIIDLEANIKVRRDLLDSLNTNPGIENILNLLRKIGL